MPFSLVAVANSKAWPFISGNPTSASELTQKLVFPIPVDEDGEGLSIGRNELAESLGEVNGIEKAVESVKAQMKTLSRKQIVLHVNKEGKVTVEGVGANPSLFNGESMEKGKKYKLTPQDTIHLNASGLFAFQLTEGAVAKSGKRKLEKEEESSIKKPKKEDKMEIDSGNKKKVGVDRSGSFYEFQKLCAQIEAENSYTKKTEIVKEFVKTFKGDLYLLCRLLLAREDKRVYNLREKAFANLLSRYLNHPSCTKQDILTDFEQGDMSLSAKKFLEKSGKAKSKSTLTLKQVDYFLDELTKVTKETEQLGVLTEIFDICTGNDIRLFWKLVDKDLKINIGPKFVLGGLHPKAFDAYMNSNNLKLIVERVQDHSLDQLLKEEKANKKEKGEGKNKEFDTQLSLFNPVKPQLARQCGSVDEVFTRCANGAWTEIKYDGERLQIHKNGDEFKFFSRNLKNVLEWKVKPVREYVMKATNAKSIILDGEILLMDSVTRKPLPFGTLAIHKKNQFSSATVCVFMFDLLYLEGKSLLQTPLETRRKLLEENVKVIPSHIEFSEQYRYNSSQKNDFSNLLNKVISEGLEGLVIKDRLSVYSPGLRHWNKIKKDYLKGMADSADLIVLGANYGTGRMGGLMSVFLMGVYDEDTKTFKTVCKCGNGHDDATIARLQKELKMKKIAQDHSKVPKWLEVDKSHTPDFVVANPKDSPVWEIEGAEFSYSPKHTADSISIRFPRVTKIRDDKDWQTATSLAELKQIVKASEQTKRLLFKPPSLDVDAAEEAPPANPEDFKSYLKEYKEEEEILPPPLLPPKKEEKKSKPKKEKESDDEEPAQPKLQKRLSDFFGKRPDIEKEIKEADAKEEKMDIEYDSERDKASSFVPTSKQTGKKVKMISKHKTTELTMNEPHPNYNETITNILEQMGEIEKNLGHPVKHKAYMKAATALQLHPKKVASGSEAMVLDGIGKKIAKKIDEIIATGTLKKLNTLLAEPEIQAMNSLCKITGIGPKKAEELYKKHGIKTAKDLRGREDLLNNHQKVGLKYHDEFEERIPREEVAEVEKAVKAVLPEIDPKLIATICGSYRRQKATCGDIDMLITHPDYTSDKSQTFLKNLVSKLKAKGLLTDDLSFGEVTYHGVCKLNKEGALHRRMDILWIPYDQFFFGILYFTGSGFFNIQMRRIALENGFTLNEREILPIGETGVCGEPIPVSSEKDIFDILGMKYQEPPERDLAPTWKPTMS